MESGAKLIEYLKQVLTDPLDARLELKEIPDSEVAFADALVTFCNAVVKRQQLREESHRLEMNLEKERQRVLENHIEQQKIHFAKAMDMNSRFNEIRHDIKNHILCLHSLLASEEFDRAKQYITTLSLELRSSFPTINSGDGILDTILINKGIVAESLGIKVDYKIHLRRDIKVDLYDWNILIGNAMDNSLEACQRVGKDVEKIISIHIKEKPGLVNIGIKNTSLPPAIDQQGNPQTAKENKESHGLGLKAMAAVVEKYEGVMQTNYKEGHFFLTIMLCNV